MLVTLPLVFLAFVGVWLIATKTARGGLRAMSDTNLSLSAQNLARAVGQALSDARSDAVTTARLDLAAEAIETRDPKNIEWYADEMVRTKGKYAAIVVANADGDIVASSSVGRDGEELRVSLAGRSIAGEPWAAGALAAERDRAVWVPPGSPRFLDGVLEAGERVVGFSLPVFDILDERVGTVTVLVSLRSLAYMLQGTGTAPGGKLASMAMVVDGEGQPIVLPREMAAKARWQQARVPDLRGDRAFAWNDFVGVQRPIESPDAGRGWRVVALTTSAALEGPVDQISLRLLLAFLAGAVATTLALVLVATRIVAPIRRLTLASVETDRASDFRPIPVETRDEVGVLTESFNQMLGALKTYQLDLEEKIAQLEESRRQLVIKERLEQEMEIATRIQTSILPHSFNVEGLDVAAQMLPASEVGGDYYDVLPVRNGCWIGIGDVAGHGLTAGLVMLMVQSVIAALVRDNSDAPPRELLDILNSVLFENIRHRLKQDEHVTLTLLRYRPDGSVVFAGAHEDIIVCRAETGRCERIETPGTWVGGARYIHQALVDTTFQLHPGDVMVLYSDGLTEARNAGGEQFDIDRLCAEIERAHASPVDEIRDRVLDAVTSWTHKQDDDMTLVVFRASRRTGDPSPT